MKNNFVALVPVRTGSKRVKNKNFREFFEGKSLFDIKIDQLKSTKLFKKIYVSSDSLMVKKLCKKKKVTFLKRKKKYCQDHTYPWHEIHNSILNSIPGDPYVAWCLTTAPLFKRFEKAIIDFKKNKNIDSLVGVLPSKNFVLNTKGKPKNFNPGCWHPYSQELEKNFFITGSIFMAKKSSMLLWKYWFGIKPHMFNLSKIESVDVDTMEDFKFAQKIFKL